LIQLFKLACGVLCAATLARTQEPADLLRRAETDLNEGRYATAIQEALRGAELFKRSGDVRGRASALTFAGLGQMYSGDYPPAIQNLSDALATARDTNDFAKTVARLNDLGNAYYFEGRYSDAMARYLEAKRLIEAVRGNPEKSWASQLTTANIAILYQTVGQFERALALYTELLAARAALAPEEHAQLLTNMGALRRRLGDPQKALATYREAQAVYRKISHRDGEIAVLNNIGIVQALDFHDNAAADATFTEALQMAESSGDRPLAVHARLYRGESLYREGQLEKSWDDFRAAASLAHELREQDEEWKALFGMARLAVSKGDGAQAAPLLRDAVALIEALRNNSGTASLRSAFLKDKRAVYDLLVQLAASAEEAFQWMESSRARTLRDLLHKRNAVSLKQVQESLPSDTAVMEFWVGEESAAVVWVSRRQSGIKRWRTTIEQSEGIQRAVSPLADPRSKTWRDSLRPLSQTLLSGVPVLDDAGIRNLVIVPDSYLTSLPFEALPLHDSHLLIERFGVSYAPSAYVALEKHATRATRWPWQLTLLALADPRPGNEGQDVATPEVPWSALPEASREVEGIAETLGGKSGLHIGADAKKAWLYSAGEYTVLHLATHAFADQRDANLSYVLLAPASARERFDYLFLKEVYDLRLSGAELVTLSACETAVGTFVAGEGQQNLSQAFLGVGAPAVLASLWRVGDKPTAALMLKFYRNLAGGQPAAIALRNAKLEFLAQPGSAHPAYWAAFVLSGDPNFKIPFLVSWKILSIVTLLAPLTMFLALKGWQKRRDSQRGLVSKDPNDLYR
jgi:CHAT domain-containing protein